MAAVALMVLMAAPPPAKQADSDTCMLWDMSQGPHLRGAVIVQRRIYPHIDGEGDFLGRGTFGAPYAQRDFDALAAQGANAVLLSHPGVLSETAPYKLDHDALAHLTKLVSMAHHAGLFVVIGLRTGPGRSEFTFHVGEHGRWFGPEMYNDTIWRDEKAQASWLDMWRVVAGNFAGHPAVVGYEVMVEPNSNHIGLDTISQKPGLWEAAAFAARFRDSLLDWSAFYPKLVGAIREKDSSTPILISANSYGSASFLQVMKKISDPCVIYSIHHYEPEAHTGQGSDEKLPLASVAADPSAWLKPAANFAHRQKERVAVTEFGVTRWAPDAARDLASAFSAFESYGMNHFLFHWPSSHRPYENIVNQFNYSFGPSPSSSLPEANNPLMEVIAQNWRLNIVRPSRSSLGLRGRQ
jgi:hypothetical protein